MKWATWIVLVCISMWGCETSHRNVQTTIVAQQYLLNANDLDLELITAHLKANGGEANPELLEKWINSTPGVDNVDLDKDTFHDFISVKEDKNDDPSKRTLSLIANPKTGEPVVAAELQFEKRGTETVFAASYPNYVQGGADRYYQESLENAAFATWLWSTRPIYVYPRSHYSTFVWADQVPVLNAQSLRTTRTTTRTTTTVAPIKKIQRPASYESHSELVQKVQAQRVERAPSTSISSTAGAGQNFVRRNDATPKPTVNNLFKSSPPVAAPMQVAPKPQPITLRPSVSASSSVSAPVRAAPPPPSRPVRSPSSNISSGAKR